MPGPCSHHHTPAGARQKQSLFVMVIRRCLGCQTGRLNLPRYFITWSGHVQACVQDWPSRNRGVFPAVDHDRSRT